MTFADRLGAALPHPLSMRERRKLRLRARRGQRLAVIVVGSVVAGAVAVLFAKVCDLATAQHMRLIGYSKALGFLALALSLPATVWLTRKLAPESAGSGIPQIIAAAESQRPKLAGDARVSLWTAGCKIVICALLLLCGASIGREGPTVQVCAAVVYLFGARLHGGPGRRALLIAGGAAGVAAAFNAPIAGVVFAGEELSKAFDKRTNTVVILVVVAAGVAAYALAGNYSYFSELREETALGSAWFSAPVVGVVCGLMGGAFSRVLAGVIGPRKTVLGRWKDARPLLFALGCGVVAALAAFLSHGLSYGAGYAEANSLVEGHPGRGLTLAVFKWFASVAAAGCGAPGGIFSPSLATGAGAGAALAHILPFASGRDTIVLGMAAYLSGVVQAPFTSAVILMEMTRDPGLVGPLFLTSLIARAVSGLVMPEPIYHNLAHTWAEPIPPRRWRIRPHHEPETLGDPIA
jgi:H+/Cl- antiporter ClcA